MLDNIIIVSKGDTGGSDIIEEGAGRITLYMAHLHRAVVQERRIGEYIDYIRNAELGCSDFIILD